MMKNKNKLCKQCCYKTIGIRCLTYCVIALLTAHFLNDNIFLEIIMIFVLFLIILEFYNALKKCKQETYDLADKIESVLDKILDSEEITYFISVEDFLYSKVYDKIYRVYEMKMSDKKKNEHEMEVIHKLISDISHQVKTPISNIKMYNQLLQKYYGNDDIQTYYLNIMEAQIDKLDFLMQALIKMSRLETDIITLHISKYRIIDMIAMSIGGLVNKIEEKNLNLEVNCDEKIYGLFDIKWTVEAIFNILDNAVKYTEPGGKICIFVEKVQEFVKIDISDTGCGIEEEHIPLIFKRFYRSEKLKEIEGLGLGLNLSREIIIKENGYISVESVVGKGSVFSVFLQSDYIGE